MQSGELDSILYRILRKKFKIIGIYMQLICLNVIALKVKVSALIYLSRYLDQETAKGPFRSSSPAVTCYYQSIGLTTQR